MKRTKTTLIVPSDVPSALEALGLPVERVQGSEVIARCPAHQPDRDPSWSVNRETGLHHCFSCHYRGNFVGLVMDRTDLGSVQATAWVKRQGPRRRAEFKEYVAPTPAPLGDFVDPPAKAVLKRRLIPSSLEFYGVRWDRERPAWVIPIRGPEGEYRGYQRKGRAEVRNVPPGLKKQDTFFGIERFSGYRAILVESPLDVVRLHTEGLEGGLAVFGSALSEDQELLLLNIGVEVIVAAFDNDSAGHRARQKLVSSSILWPTQQYAFRYPKLGEDKDPGDLSGKEIWDGVLNAEWITNRRTVA
jgi:hypothetical protein